MRMVILEWAVHLTKFDPGFIVERRNFGAEVNELQPIPIQHISSLCMHVGSTCELKGLRNSGMKNFFLENYSAH